MERQPRDFTGVWIPREIWLSQQLSLMEKLLFIEILSLDGGHGCFPSNAYFARFLDRSHRQIRTYLASLKDKGFITVTIKSHNRRVIRAARKYARFASSRLSQKL